MARFQNVWKLTDAYESMPIFLHLGSLYTLPTHSPINKNKTDYECYITLCTKLQEILESISNSPPVNHIRKLPFSTIFAMAEMVIHCVIYRSGIYQITMEPDYKQTTLGSHCVNVAFLVSKVGMALKLPFSELTQLTVSALIHDIGMMFIDTKIYENEKNLTDKEREIINRHPQLGYSHLKEIEPDIPWLLRVILEEHIRENGEGYPAVNKPHSHLYSRIVGLCDAFEALTHTRPYRKALHPADAMRIVVQESKSNHFDLPVVRAFIETIGMYPVGSLVELNSRKIARVIGTNYGAPVSPVIELLDEQNESAAQYAHLDLSKDNTIYITGLVYTDSFSIPEQNLNNQRE